MCVNFQELFQEFKGLPEEIIPLLQKVQGSLGYLSQESMESIAKFVGVESSKVYSVATFYAQFRFEAIGEEHISVCRGTACHVNGAPAILEELERQLNIKEGQTTSDGKYSIETVACIGCCSLAPCLTVNNKVEAKVTPKKIVEKYGKSSKK